MGEYLEKICKICKNDEMKYLGKQDGVCKGGTCIAKTVHFYECTKCGRLIYY